MLFDKCSKVILKSSKKILLEQNLIPWHSPPKTADKPGEDPAEAGWTNLGGNPDPLHFTIKHSTL